MGDFPIKTNFFVCLLVYKGKLSPSSSSTCSIERTQLKRDKLTRRYLLQATILKGEKKRGIKLPGTVLPPFRKPRNLARRHSVSSNAITYTPSGKRGEPVQVSPGWRNLRLWAWSARGKGNSNFDISAKPRNYYRKRLENKKKKKCEVSDMNTSTVSFINIFSKKRKKRKGNLLFPTWFYRVSSRWLFGVQNNTGVIFLQFVTLDYNYFCESKMQLTALKKVCLFSWHRSYNYLMRGIYCSLRIIVSKLSLKSASNSLFYQFKIAVT